MDKGEALLLVDLDDTLFFTGRCVELAGEDVMGKRMKKEEIRKLPENTKERIYKIAQSKYDKYTRLNKKLNKILARIDDSDIFILTARTKKTKGFTERLLERNNVKFDRIIFRDNYRIKDEVWKLKLVNRFSKLYQKITLYEDKFDNINYIRDHAKGKNMGFYAVSGGKIKKL